MGIFSKLFSKKEEEPGEQELFPRESLGLDEKPVSPETAYELPPHLEEPASLRQQAQPLSSLSSRDIDLLNSKLDTIKALLNSLDQRLASLERIAGVEQKKMPW